MICVGVGFGSVGGGGLINDGGNVDLAVMVFGFWLRLILFFFFF